MATSDHPVGDNRAFAVEQHGIDHIPETSRNATPREIFSTWFGANVIFTYIVIGAIVGSLGMPLWQSLGVVVLGNLLYVLVGLTSIAGPRAGTAMLTVSRSAFGIVGNRLPSVLSWLTTIGWTTVNMVIGTLSLVTLADLAGLGSGTAVKVLALVLVTGVTVAITVLGHATILVVNTVLSFALGIGTAVLGVLVVGEAVRNGADSGGEATFGTWLIAFAVVAAAPMSYVNTGADYSRYLPVGTPARTITLVTASGSFIPATLIGAVGVVAASVTDMTDPIAGLQGIVPEVLLVVYLAVVVGGTITNNFLNTYSSGMSLLAVGVSTTRTRATMLNISLALAVTCYVVFFRDFSEFLIAFLTLMIVWSSAWCGVFLADMALRRSRYDVDGLQQTSGGPYWYRSGWNVPATAWFLVGALTSALFATSTIWTGSLTAWVDGGDLSIPAGLLVAGLGYYLHARARGLVTPTGASGRAPAPTPTSTM
ncbi:purine-cytosine permease family protein [Geodermatophilus marinus]|uniref:purine-cytosine permease family protein n=1 Tax=Geodermatophilus sp. LHW52908 TaxID=2303986 RepID=UPI000E3E11A6|nr:cytosine permease [Geodermatophilus sp. LHW52908]RFU19402.1 cytosine or purine or uracil or thiamine or allantoin permease [Geodermatophilus sp. LHW52908]